MDRYERNRLVMCVAIVSAVVVLSLPMAIENTTTSPPVPFAESVMAVSSSIASATVSAPPPVETEVYADVPLDMELIKAVMLACDTYNVPLELALAVMEVESCYQIDAVNGACVGLYQINTDYISAYEEALGVTDIADLVQNIQSGVWYLGQLLGKHGEVNLALMHYNLGNKADRLWKQGQHGTHYTDKVNDAWVRLGGEGNGT